MEIISKFVSHKLDIEKYFDKERICFMDIETTGFSRKYNIIYLIGLLSFNSQENNWELLQFFASSFKEEKDLLEGFIGYISSFDRLITYNGDSFDLPFIESRARHYKMDFHLDRNKSFDLYQVVKANKDYLDLPDLKLKTVERSLGFYREDQYSGGDCIKFYLDYVKNGDGELKDLVLKHNHDDLVHMLDILPILDLIEGIKTIDMGSNDNKYIIEDMNIKGGQLNIEGNFHIQLDKNLRYFDNSFSLISKSYQQAHISIEFNKGYISENEVCSYIYLDSIEGLEGLVDQSGYSLVDNILVLAIEGKIQLENIRILLERLLMISLK